MKNKIFTLTLMLLLAACSRAPQTLQWQNIKPEELETRPIDLIDNQWLALSTGNQAEANSMTISWGCIGELWSKPVFIVFVSEDRFTKHLMDRYDTFTVTAFPKDQVYRNALQYLGSASGRNEDKMKGCGLTVRYSQKDTPYFDEGELMIECRKIYADAFNENLVPEDVRERMYSRMGIHTLYIGEIINVQVKR